MRSSTDYSARATSVPPGRWSVQQLSRISGVPPTGCQQLLSLLVAARIRALLCRSTAATTRGNQGRFDGHSISSIVVSMSVYSFHSITCARDHNSRRYPRRALYKPRHSNSNEIYVSATAYTGSLGPTFPRLEHHYSLLRLRNRRH